MRPQNQKVIYGPSFIGKQAQLVNQYSSAASQLQELKSSQRYSQPGTSKQSAHRGSSGVNISANHVKTKSIQMSHGPGVAIQNLFPDGAYSLNQSGVGPPQPQPTTKMVSKHIRHVSGPTVGSAPYQFPREAQNEPKLAPQIHSVNVSSLGSALATVTNHINTSQVSNRPKQNLSGSIQIGHNRISSTKMGTDVSKEKKAQETYQDYTDLTQHTNYSSVSQPGHKKSVSLANSKITQLLLKAGYNHANKAGKSKGKIKAKPKVSESLLLTSDHAKPSLEMIKDSHQNKSGEFGQLQNFAIYNALHELSDEQIQRILTFDERDLNSIGQDLTYNDILRQSQKSSGATTALPKSEVGKAKQALNQIVQKSFMNPVKERISDTYGVEKIQNHSKIITSGAAVRKPQSKSFQNSSLGARASVVEAHINLNQNQQDTKQPLASAPSHHRTKSDQLSASRAITNFQGVIQMQQKKVGEILKNNFLDSAVGSSAASGKNVFSSIVTTNTTAALSKQVKSFAMHEHPQVISQTQQVSQVKKAKIKRDSQEQHDLIKSVVKKTTKEKYNELKQQYDDLAEKYCLALAAAQASNNQLEPKVITLTAQKKGIGSSLSSLSSNTISSINASTLHQNQVPRVTRFIKQDSRPLKSNREQNNIRIENDLEGWSQTMPVEEEKKATNLIKIDKRKAAEGSTDPTAQKAKAMLVKVENNKVILSSRDRKPDEPHKKIKVVQTKADSKAEIRKTPEHLPEANKTIDQDTGKARKLELSNRHRRSFSDGNDAAAQFKFMQAQKQILDKKTGILHQIIGLESVQKGNCLSEDTINTINPPPSTHALNGNWEKIIEKWEQTDTGKKSKHLQGQAVIKVQHQRLKSEDIQTKKPTKSNSIYTIIQPSATNISGSIADPANEGNINTPTLELQIRNFLNEHKQSLPAPRLDFEQQQVMKPYPVNFREIEEINPLLDSQRSPKIKAAIEIVSKKVSNNPTQRGHHISRSIQAPANRPMDGNMSQSLSFEPNPSNVMKPQVNNLLHFPVALNPVFEVKACSRSTSRTAYSKDSEQKHTQNASDTKEQQVKQPKQMILKSQMQALVAQQPSGNKIQHHKKNKLSNASDSQHIAELQYRNEFVRASKKEEPQVASRESSNHKNYHKRVKSDAVETRQQKFIPIGGPIKDVPSVSFKNLPVKEKPESISPMLITPPPNFFLGLDGASDDRKLVNVSIDLINEDGLAADEQQSSTQLQGGQWYEIKQVQNIENTKQTQEKLLAQFNQGRLTKHRKNNEILDNGQLIQKILRQAAPKPQLVSKSAERSGHEKQNSDVVRLEKYKYMLQKAKTKFQSKSEVPQSIIIQEDFQMNEDQFFKNQHASPHFAQNQAPKETKITKKKVKQVRKSQEPAMPVRKPKGNAGNMMIIEDESELSKKPQAKTPTECFVPTNSMAPSNAEISEHLQSRAIPQEEFIDDRLLTCDSVANDTTLSPRQKLVKKLTKYIQKSYQHSDNCPATTIDFYRIGKILGKGAFGKVNLALHQLTKRMVAIKSINKSYFNEESQSTKVKQEVVILKQTRHRNIVKLYEYFETQKHILLVTEICAGGDLLNYVRKRRQLKEDVAKSLFKQIIEGIGYCHSKNILHRDIKLDNILLAWNGEVKIGDFGVSKVVKKGEVMNEQCGTPAYIAPEILLDRGYSGFGADIWSAGVVLFAMLYGTVPFKANNMQELQKIIIKAQYQLQDSVSKEGRNLLEGLLEKDPEKRLTIRGILKHPWMKDAKDTVELFTSAEQNYIRTEYTYGNVDRYNRNEPDNFMDGALDTERNEELKNADTKSIILAPFNSTKSHITSNESFLSEIRDMMQSRGCIYFVGKVREIDKQYEVNNNADLDNGVYHDFGKDDEEQAKKSPEKSEVKQTELEKLESMIRQEEESVNNYSNRSDEQPYECGDEESIPIMKQLQPSNSKSLVTRDQQLESSFNANQTKKALVQANTLTIDSSIIEQVSHFGYPSTAVVRYLNNNELNSATTCYFLLCQHEIDSKLKPSDSKTSV